MNLNRRQVLKATGMTMALPYLESFSAEKSSAEKRRVLWYYTPNGIVPTAWFPKTTGTDYHLSPSLQPLKNLQKDITIISGLDREFASGTDVHAQCGCCWMTSGKPSERTDGPFPLNTTLDQVIASNSKSDTPFSSLSFSCNDHKDNREAKHYDSISWYSPGYSAESQTEPEKIFKRLFRSEVKYSGSVLDLILDDAAKLKNKLCHSDQNKLDEYFSSIRSVELQTERLAKKQALLNKVSVEEKKLFVSKRSEYMQTMADLAVLAFQTDLTRVLTFMAGPERWQTPHLFDTVLDKPVTHHSLTHDKNAEEQVALIDLFYMEQYAYIIDKLKSTKDAEGQSLLDNTMTIMGAGLGNGFTHDYTKLPIIIAGHASGTIQPGSHIKYPEGTPLANLWLSVADYMGVNLPRFADSTGPIKNLFKA